MFLGVFITSCSAADGYEWTDGLSATEAEAECGGLYTEYTSELSEALLSEAAISSLESQRTWLATSYSTLSGEELPEEFNKLVGYAEYYPAGDSMFAVYWFGLAGAQEENYLDIHLVTEDSDTAVFSMETLIRYVRLVGDGEQLYILHSDGILSAIGTDGRVRELYDARVVTADTQPMPEYASLHLDTRLSGEGMQLICEPSFLLDSDGDGLKVRYDRIVYDVEKNKLISHEQGEPSPL